MDNFYRKLCLVIVSVGVLFPSLSLAAAQKTITGSVVRITTSGIVFSNTNAATYSAELGAAVLTRKNGSPMQFGEIAVGDKIAVAGTLWNDNSISATSFRDLSLYAHTSSFTGKITTINPVDFSFTMQSKTYGNQTVQTNSFTAFKKNSSLATFKDLQLGMSTTVKGVWERTPSTVLATQVSATLRLVNIYFTGTISMKNGNSLTVIGNGNVIYGVDMSGAAIQNKTGKAAMVSQFNIGDTVRVWGKHVSGTVQITATTVRDSSLTN